MCCVRAGIFRAMPVRKNQNFRHLGSVFKTYIDVVHFKKSSESRVGCEDAQAEQVPLVHWVAWDDGVLQGADSHTTFNEGDTVEQQRMEQKERVEAMSRRPDIYEVTD